MVEGTTGKLCDDMWRHFGEAGWNVVALYERNPEPARGRQHDVSRWSMPAFPWSFSDAPILKSKSPLLEPHHTITVEISPNPC